MNVDIVEYLKALIGLDSNIPKNPDNRVEIYLAAILGKKVKLPSEPLSDVEKYLLQILERGLNYPGGSGPEEGTGLSRTIDIVDGYKNIEQDYNLVIINLSNNTPVSFFSKPIIKTEFLNSESIPSQSDTYYSVIYFIGQSSLVSEMASRFDFVDGEVTQVDVKIDEIE